MTDDQKKDREEGEATRRTISFPGDLYDRVQQAAATEGAVTGRPISVSEWLRMAAEEKMERMALHLGRDL